MKDSSLSRSQNRFIFFDNVRFFVIVFVVLQHVALIYGTGEQKAYFSQLIFTYIVMITDIFMMPVLFFAAGFFALPSIERRGNTHFIVNKFRRLGLPWLIGVIFIVPVAVYFMYYSRSVNDGLLPMGYWNYWVMFMKNALKFHTGYISSPDQFSHRHLWFLSVLLSVFLLFAPLYTGFKKLKGNSVPRHMGGSPSDSFIVLVLFMVGFITALGFFIVKLYFKWGYQAILVVSLIHFEPSRLVSQVMYFVLGLYAYSRKWFSGDKALGSLILWVPLCILFSAVHVYLENTLPAPLSVGHKCMLSFSRSFLCLSIFAVLISFAKRFWNSPSAMNKKFADNSYTIYVIHYPLPALSAVLLRTWNAHVLTKSGIVFVSTLLISFLLSDYLVRQYPRLAVHVW